MAKSKQLRGSSKIVFFNGSTADVRDDEGSLCMTGEEWHKYQQQIGMQISHAVNQLLKARPELKTAYDMTPDEQEKVITMMDLLDID